MTNDLKYLVLSDIHLGNKRVTTEEIIANLDSYFDNYLDSSQFTDLDMLFIAGDLFDRLLEFSCTEVNSITTWLSRLMWFCSRHHIRLRILEGTPSHDWKQSKIAHTVYMIISKDNVLDFKYVDTLYIEVLKDIQLHILYVPDEYSSSTEETFSQVKSLMSNLGIHQVDIAIMHGSFEYQLRNVPGNIQKHSEANYLSVVKHFISIGHIHEHSVNDRIVAQGSFDRLGFGEEHPKGGVVLTISKGGNYFNFIENTHAKIFKTIEVRNVDLDKVLARIDKVASSVPNNSYIRIKAKATHAIYIAFDELKLKYPMLYFVKAKLEDESDNFNTNLSLSTDDNFIPITITMDNIIELLTSEIKAKHSLSDAQLLTLSGILEHIHV